MLDWSSTLHGYQGVCLTNIVATHALASRYILSHYDYLFGALALNGRPHTNKDPGVCCEFAALLTGGFLVVTDIDARRLITSTSKHRKMQGPIEFPVAKPAERPWQVPTHKQQAPPAGALVTRSLLPVQAGGGSCGGGGGLRPSRCSSLLPDQLCVRRASEQLACSDASLAAALQADLAYEGGLRAKHIACAFCCQPVMRSEYPARSGNRPGSHYYQHLGGSGCPGAGWGPPPAGITVVHEHEVGQRMREGWVLPHFDPAAWAYV